jgi:hypothetical protein
MASEWRCQTQSQSSGVQNLLGSMLKETCLQEEEE